MRDLVLAGVSVVVAVVLIAIFWDDNYVLTFFAAIHVTLLLKFWHEVEDLMYFTCVLIVGTDPVGDTI